MDDKKKFISSLILPVGFVLLLWVIKLSEIIFNINFISFGILPGSIRGIPGILFAPLIHANIKHLFSNSLPILFLGTGIIYFYRHASYKVMIIIYLGTDILDWIFARKAYHIGASGIIYGFVTFLFFSGIIRRDTRAIALALLVTFLYGSLIWGVLPLDSGVSWESHLFGSILGIFCAFLYKDSDPAIKYEWEYEDDDDEKNNDDPEL
ncbi:MAG: rhomboid family intramembrane serine protease [Ignavibacteriaceae bacterium]|nr:rhomboid family intramembrane serine protease [Ignavibacteriaceae bacterium]